MSRGRRSSLQKSLNAGLSIAENPIIDGPHMSGVDFLGFENDDGLSESLQYSTTAVSQEGLKRNSFIPQFSLQPQKNYFLSLKASLQRGYHYNFRAYLVADILSGLTAGIMMLPQGLAYASLARLPPIYGLFPGFIPALVYALLGPCKQSSVGPEALNSELVGMILSEVHPEERVQTAAVLSMMFGLILLIMGLLRLGFIESILSHAVVQGFVLAVAVTIIIEQLPAMLGFVCKDCEGSGVNKLWTICQHTKDFSSVAITVSIVSVCFLLCCGLLKHKMSKKVPCIVYFSEILVLVVLATAVTYGGNLHGRYGLAVLGVVDSHFVAAVPALTFQRLVDLSPIAFVIALVAYTESTVVLKRYSKKHKYRASANSELVALGLANFIGSFFGSYGCQGSLPRSQVQDGTGAKTNFSLTVSALFVGLAMVALLPAFKYLPKPVMAAIVFVAAVRLMEFKLVFFFFQVRKFVDLLLWAVVAAVTLLVGIEEGVFAGIAGSLLILVKTTSVPSLRVLGELVSERSGEVLHGTFGDMQTCRNTRSVPGVLVVKIEGQVFFANVSRLEGMFQRIDVIEQLRGAQEETVHTYVLDLGSVQAIDASGLHTLLELIQDKKESFGLRVLLVLRDPELLQDLQRAGVLALLPGDVFDSLDQAVLAARARSAMLPAPSIVKPQTVHTNK